MNEIQKKIIKVASCQIQTAYILNALQPPVSNIACGLAFKVAKQMMNDVGLAGNAIVEMAVESGEYSANDLETYASMFDYTDNRTTEQKKQDALTEHQEFVNEHY